MSKIGLCDRSGGQGIELICSGRDLPLPDHVHGLDTGQQNARTTERLEAEHGAGNAFDGAMVLLHDVVQILHLAQFNWRARVGLHTPYWLRVFQKQC